MSAVPKAAIHPLPRYRAPSLHEDSVGNYDALAEAYADAVARLDILEEYACRMLQIIGKRKPKLIPPLRRQ